MLAKLSELARWLIVVSSAPTMLFCTITLLSHFRKSTNILALSLPSQVDHTIRRGSILSGWPTSDLPARVL